MKYLGKREILLLGLAALMLFGAVLCFGAERVAPLGEAEGFCTVAGCTHAEGSHCPLLAAPTFSYSGTSAPRGKGFYYDQLPNELSKKALDAIDACFNPNGSDIPTPRLATIEVHSLPAGLTAEELTAVNQQVIDVLCMERPQYFWLNKDNFRFGLQSGTKSSVLVMDISDRLINAYLSMPEAAADGEAAEAQAQTALASFAGIQGDVARLRALHDYILARTEYTYSIEQAYSFTGVLVHKRALCEGYSKAFQLLARRMGYECELVVGDGVLPDGGRELHMWNAVKVNGEWYWVDCTWDDNENLSQGDKYRYFLLSAAEAARLGDHIENGNINLKTLSDKITPRPGVKVFAFPRLAERELDK